jgi:uncharacterized membrane protein
MTAAHRSPDEREDKALERLLLFTDAVIAIVITLMVLEVKPPNIANEPELLPALKGLWHEFLAVGVSFIVIGIIWAVHHRRFRWVNRIDGGLVAINLLFLMAVSAIPFVTHLLAKHPYREATIIYAVTIAVASLLLAAIWLYATKMKLVADDVPEFERWSGFVSPLSTALIFLISIPIAFLNPLAARWFWVLVVLTTVLTRRLPTRLTNGGSRNAANPEVAAGSIGSK